MNTIYLAGIERGLTKANMQKMTIGAIVDYICEYNERNNDNSNKEAGKKPAKKYRIATPKEAAEYHRR